MFDDVLIWVRGAGEMGSAVAHILKRTGFRVIISELPYPLAIRRTVTFSDAVFGGPAEVEGITARRTDADSTGVVSNDSHIPLYIDDPEKLLSYSESQRNGDKNSGGIKDDADASAVFGATKEDMQNLKAKKGNVSLSEEAEKAGGKLDMKQMMRLAGHDV